ncbi:urokinase plasminogen activator surface receptor-like [Pseudophryne corroboree]|uniref:urokinase plasminogen activator surface receptor-like n=1 Tax=Pseudophryne corroboree TaxID=495146 RepID=UPI003081CE51
MMETSLLLVTVILSALVATSVSLSCLQCQVHGDQTCTGTPQMCPPEAEVCVSTVKSNLTDGAERKTFRRYCGDRNLCSLTGSYSVPTGKIKLSSSCCYTSGCAPPTPLLPADKTEKNKVSCKGCPTKEGKPCPSDVTMECTGDEDKCISVTFVSGHSETSVAGCSTPALCDRMYNVTDGSIKTQIHMVCQSRSAGLQQSFFLFIISTTLLLKITW